MKFAFFPGCVLKGAAAEAYTSMQKVCEALGIELEEIPNWTCCGASHAQGVNDLAVLAVNARNISIAENMGLPILTVCNTCTLQLRTAKYRLDHDAALKDKVNAILKEPAIRTSTRVRARSRTSSGSSTIIRSSLRARSRTPCRHEDCRLLRLPHPAPAGHHEP